MVSTLHGPLSRSGHCLVRAYLLGFLYLYLKHCRILNKLLEEALSWEKLFSTRSWFIMAGFITDPQSCASLMLTKEVKPRTIDCMLN